MYTYTIAKHISLLMRVKIIFYILHLENSSIIYLIL